LDRAVIGHDDGDRRIELAETAQDPVHPLFLVVALDAHRLEQLDGDLDLALAVVALVAGSHPELAAVGHAGQVALDIALADAVEHLAGDDVEVPGLGVKRGRRAHRDLEDLAHQRLGNRLLQEATDTAAAPHDVIEFHIPLLSGFWDLF
jgi:hypothetical protein